MGVHLTALQLVNIHFYERLRVCMSVFKRKRADFRKIRKQLFRFF